MFTIKQAYDKALGVTSPGINATTGVETAAYTIVARYLHVREGTLIDY